MLAIVDEGGGLAMKEADVLTQLEQRLKELGSDCVFVKVHGSPFQSAALDIIGSYRGQAFTVEVKRPGGRLTPRQSAILVKWARSGAVADVVDSAESADEFIDLLRRIGDGRMKQHAG